MWPNDVRRKRWGGRKAFSVIWLYEQVFPILESGAREETQKSLPCLDLALFQGIRGSGFRAPLRPRSPWGEVALMPSRGRRVPADWALRPGSWVRGGGWGVLMHSGPTRQLQEEEAPGTRLLGLPSPQPGLPESCSAHARRWGVLVGSEPFLNPFRAGPSGVEAPP